MPMEADFNDEDFAAQRLAKLQPKIVDEVTAQWGADEIQLLVKSEGRWSSYALTRQQSKLLAKWLGEAGTWERRPASDA